MKARSGLSLVSMSNQVWEVRRGIRLLAITIVNASQKLGLSGKDGAPSCPPTDALKSKVDCCLLLCCGFACKNEVGVILCKQKNPSDLYRIVALEMYGEEWLSKFQTEVTVGYANLLGIRTGCG